MTDRSLIKSFLAACFKEGLSSATQSFPIREQCCSTYNKSDTIDFFLSFIIWRDSNLLLHIYFRAKYFDGEVFEDGLIFNDLII